MKKIISLIVVLSTLFLSACKTAIPQTTTPLQTETTNTVIPTTEPIITTELQTSTPTNINKIPFVVDNSTSRALYYLNYTDNYKFDEFIKSGGASSTKDLVGYAQSVFPEIKLNLAALGYGCSSFCAQSSDNDIIFGRNFDMDASNSGSYLIVHTTPENGYESYSTVNLKFLGIIKAEEPNDNTSPLLLTPYIPLDGINSEGLAICVLQLDFPEIHVDGNGVDMTSTTIIRNVLDHAKNVEEAIEIFQNCDLHTDGFAYHYMIGDASGKSAVIEFVNNQMIVEYKTENVQVVANTYVSDEGIAFYKDPNSKNSHTRMNAILNSIKDNNFNLTTQNAFSALEAATNSYTRWTIVYNLTDKTLNIAINRKFDTIYTFSFNE